MKIREIPFKSMGGVYQEDDVSAAMKVISSAAEPGAGFFPLPEEDIFQEKLAKHEGAKKAVAVNSCGTALDCCMMALGIKEGDEVVTTPLTFVCTAGTVIGRVAKDVFADIDPRTMNLSPERVREKITGRTKAVIPVHFTGLPCDISAFDRITEETGVPVIYDAAHALGAGYMRTPLGGGKDTLHCLNFN